MMDILLRINLYSINNIYFRLIKLSFFETDIIN